jgi:hypothetical protein
VSGTTVSVNEGTVNEDSDWTITTNGAITPGTTAHDWRRLGTIDYGLVTALPASPSPGSLCTYTDSLTAPTYRWRLQYNAASSSSSKWECIGGTPLFAEVTTQETTTSTSYANLTTSGPTVTLPLAGDYMVEVGADMGWTSSTQHSMSYAIGATAASDNDRAKVANVANVAGPAMRRRQKTGLAASAALTAKYKVNGGTGSFENRTIEAMPIRVG